MKKTDLYSALFSLSFSLNAHAMGLGDLRVNSYLDQPFSAEIELIDVGSTPLSGIKANLASAEDYEHSGLERAYALSLLTFSVEKNSQGKVVIKVRSSERISEPFMQLFVDLSWAQGEVDRSYTVLLDPPNYKLAQKRLSNIGREQYGTKRLSHQTGAIDKPVYSHVEHSSTSADSDSREVVTYGPTAVNETVWQIAQRYKTDDILLQQMILAIVGTNPQAFTEGNLNGLKEGSYLRIPATNAARNVPEAPAKLEVLAHDKAWQARLPIEHVLFPPYMNATVQGNVKEQTDVSPLGYALTTSIIPTVPVVSKSTSNDGSALSRFLPLASSLLSVEKDASANKANPSNASSTEQGNKAPADGRETNTLLTKQLQDVQLENKRLQEQIALNDKQLKRMHKKIHRLMKQAGQGSQRSEESTIWTWVVLFLALGAGGFAYWWLWIRAKDEKPELTSDTPNPPVVEPILVPPVVETEPVIDEVVEDAPTPVDEVVEEMPKPPEQPENIPVVDVQENSTVAEEIEEVTPEETKPEAPQQEMLVDEHILEFEPTQPAAEAPQENEVEPEFKKKTKQPELTLTPNPEPTFPDLEQQPKTNETTLPEQVIKPEPIKEQKLEFDQEELLEDEHSIEFVLNPVDESPPEDKAPPLKSKAALDTLLGLAKTYIGMDDFEAAKQSLQEVLEFGNEEQQSEAQHLLDRLNEH